MKILSCLVAPIVALLLAPPASAQTGLVLFPADQYGRSYLSTAQSSGAMSTMELQNVLGRNPNFERLESYRADDRFRMLAAPVGRLDLLVQTPAGLGTSCSGWRKTRPWRAWPLAVAMTLPSRL